MVEDSIIIALFNERSERAIRELDCKYGATVRKTAANILTDNRDVEECENDTYLGVWNTVPPQNPNPLISYVCKIARNLAIKKYYSNTAKKRNGNYDIVLDELEECIPSSTNVESQFEVKEISSAVSRFLNTISYEDRFCFIRRYWYMDSVSDISTIIHINSRQVSVRLFRVRKKLNEYLRSEGLI